MRMFKKLFLVLLLCGFFLAGLSIVKADDSVVNYDEKNIVSCGNGLLTDVPALVPKTVHVIYLLLQIAVPVILVLFGTIDFVKAITGQKDDEIKKGQQTFIKRLFTAVLIFFIFSIVKLLISFVNSDSDRGINNVMSCTKCLINNDDNCVR